MEITSNDDFLQSAKCVALGLQRTTVFRMVDVMAMSEYRSMISIPLGSNPKRELAPGKLDEFELILQSHYFAERIAVMKRLTDLNATEILATFDVAQIELWLTLLKYSGADYMDEQTKESKGYYPRERVPPFACRHFLPRLKHCQSVVKDARVLQPIFALMTIVGESLDDITTLKFAVDESLKLTKGQVLELTPVGIPESYAYALQRDNHLEEALQWYMKALDGIKTSVMRQKTDAIVLQACLIQGQSDKQKALRMAFTYSPYFSSAQQYIIGGPGRALLVQQCQRWAVLDLTFPSLDEAEEALMKRD